MDEDSLKKEIQIELENLNRLVDEMEQLKPLNQRLLDNAAAALQETDEVEVIPGR